MVKRKTTADALGPPAGGASVGSLRVAVDAIYSDLAAKKAELEAQRAENLRVRRRLADAEAALSQLQAEQDAALVGDVASGGSFSTSADDVVRLRKRCAALKIENRRLKDVEADAQAALAANRQLRRDNEALEKHKVAVDDTLRRIKVWFSSEREAVEHAFDRLADIFHAGADEPFEAVEVAPTIKRGPGKGRRKMLKVSVETPTANTTGKIKKSVTPSPTAATIVAPSPSPSTEPKKRGASVSPRVAPPVVKEDTLDDDESISLDDESDEDYVPGREGKKRGKPAAADGVPTKRRRAAVSSDGADEGFSTREREMIELLHEMDASNAWDEIYAKRPTFSLTFDYEKLAPTAKEWVDNALQFHFDHRRAFWERTHWVTMERNFSSQILKSLYRERLSRRTEAVRTWKELVKDGSALIDQGLLPDNVWREPFWWGWPQAPHMLPLYIKTMKDIVDLDARQPQRVVCVNDITQEPYYKELVENGCTTRYPLPDPPNASNSS